MPGLSKLALLNCCWFSGLVDCGMKFSGFSVAFFSPLLWNLEKMLDSILLLEFKVLFTKFGVPLLDVKCFGEPFFWPVVTIMAESFSFEMMTLLSLRFRLFLGNDPVLS